MREAKWWEPVNDRVKCTLCPRYCKLKRGQRGFCVVRQNVDGKLETSSYGNLIAVHVDPIEKKPLYHFLPGTKAFSIGTIGCNFGCIFCQNWDIARAEAEQYPSKYFSPQDVVNAALEYNCKSVSFTYNEPTIFGEYIIDVAKLAHKSGLKTTMVTNGYITKEAIRDIYPLIDAANIDLKSFSEKFYSKYCLAHLQPVLDAILEIKKAGTFIELTTLIIPGVNDSEEEIKMISNWVIKNLGTDTPLHFSAFHPDYKMRNHIPTSKSMLDKARKIALDAGINYVYEGNVISEDEGNTYCSKCGRLLVERQWFTVVHNTLNDGKCVCGNEIPGVFE